MENPLIPSALLLVVAYLVGSIPFAVLVSKLLKLDDPRNYGSGNPGATNVLRSGNKLAALMTLLGDALKGWVVVWGAQKFSGPLGLPEWALALSALAVFLGHVYSCFLKFKGGKGVATAAGVLFGITPSLGALTLGAWLLVAVTTRYSSLAAVVAAIAAPLLCFWRVASPMWAMICVLMSAVLVWRHKDNIRRLLAGEESRIGSKKKA